MGVIPDKIGNIVGAEEIFSRSGDFFEKRNPHTGEVICQVTRTKPADISAVLDVAERAQALWAATPGVKRGEILFEVASVLKARQREVAEVVSLETGKSMKDALGEVGGAVQQGFFMAAEGQRLFGRTTQSGVANRYPIIVREPMGVCGLITAANTPIANVAWKAFPALICGNSAVLKSSEDTPLTARIFGQLALEAGLPPGVLNILQGLGEEAGAPLVESSRVQVISFTGSTSVGRFIAKVAGERLAKVCLELGGKNPLIVCDDAHLENAVKWTLLSAFSNAGQRCASATRIIIFDKVYEDFKSLLLSSAKNLKIGNRDNDDFGPVINETQLKNMLAAVQSAKGRGATLLLGGNRIDGDGHRRGYYMEPTILEGLSNDDLLSKTELFGPITCLYRVNGFNEALAMANDSPYGLTASIHTSNFSRAIEFSRKIQSGVAIINAGTYGSEPHMPFGGVKFSGNGTREPGPEALDVYSNLKVIYENVLPERI